MLGRTDWKWLLHPFLAATYFVLTLAAANVQSLDGWNDLAWPIPTMLAVAGVAWVTGHLLTRNPRKAALLGLLWTVAFSVYGYLADALSRGGVLPLVGGEVGLVVAFLAIVVGPSLAIARSRRTLGASNQFASVVTVLLVGYTGVAVLRGLALERSVRMPIPAWSIHSADSAPRDAPDIYLLLLDQYTGGDMLRRGFGHDNSTFEEWLRGRGFVVPAHARANYPQTQLSLASMLNLEYVQRLPPGAHLYDLIEHNRLAAFLKQRGYRFVFFPTGYKFTARNRNADLQLPGPSQVGSEFGGVWQRTTMLPEVLQAVCGLAGCRAGRLVYVSEDAALLDWKFQRLAEQGGGSRPSFVFAHLGITHEPYLYYRDCTHRDPYWPADGGLRGDEEARRAYLDQIACANRKLESLVSAIVAAARRPVVILLQADHGHGRLGRHLPELRGLDPARVQERMSVFAAYRLPGVSPAAVSDSITPVNATRLVLRHYFGAELLALEDESYWSTRAQRLGMVKLSQ